MGQSRKITMPLDRKPVVWVSSARKNIQAMPSLIRREFGVALDEAQEGRKPLNAKPLRGFKGASVVEIVESFDSDAYRAVYTVRFEEAIYVLHVFQKKSRRGIETSSRDLELIRTRLQQAEELHLKYVQRLGEIDEL